jgi:hypothetical protein
MPQIIYTVPGATSSAFVPVPAATTAALAVHPLVSGQPGTQGIPAAPAELAGQINGGPVRSGYSGGTGMMPPVWFPNLYYQRALWPNSSGVSIYSDNQMPVPAADPRGKAAVLARPPVFLGQSQLAQPKGLPRWANWLASPNYGG